MPQAALDTHEEVRKLKQAGCPEEHAEAMVDLVSRAPLNAKIASRLERLESKVDIIEANMATKADLETLTLRVESIEANMATKADLEALRADTVDRTESSRADLTRMLWIQGLGLATLIISLAGMMLYLAGWPRT